MTKFDDVIGKLCEVLLPIKDDVYFGSKNSHIAVCTLSSLKLMRQLAQSGLLNDVCLIGRLLSENKGIENLVRNTISNERLKVIVLCGKDVWGHKAGHSLLQLHKYGIDGNSKIRHSHSPQPFVGLADHEVKKFQEQVALVDKRGECDPGVVCKFVESLKN